jgi:hypothetical protein
VKTVGREYKLVQLELFSGRIREHCIVFYFSCILQRKKSNKKETGILLKGSLGNREGVITTLTSDKNKTNMGPLKMEI